MMIYIMNRACILIEPFYIGDEIKPLTERHNNILRICFLKLIYYWIHHAYFIKTTNNMHLDYRIF